MNSYDRISNDLSYTSTTVRKNEKKKQDRDRNWMAQWMQARLKRPVLVNPRLSDIDFFELCKT